MFDLAIVGAGPAGMAAAEVACEHGMRVVIIDEQDRAGGQILRRPPSQFTVRNWLPQRVYRHLHALYARFTDSPSLTHLNNTSVLGISQAEHGFTLQILSSTQSKQGLQPLDAKRILIATGCFDMPLAFKGAQLPGVMATGGLQAFLKSQQIIPGDKFLFVGSHPLQLIVANQVLAAGGDVAGIMFTQPLSAMLRVARSPLVLLRQLPNILFIMGVVIQLLAKRVPIKFGTQLISAEGEHALERVKVKSAKSSGELQNIDCDRLGICFGFLTNNDLLRQAGGHCEWSQSAGGWIATHDDGMRSSVPGIYVAGETTGVAGANVAYFEGRLAALSANLDAEKISTAAYAKACNTFRGSLTATRDFAVLLAQLSYPGDALIAGTMDNDAYLCKCEEVTVGSVVNTLADNPDVTDLNALKLLTRCGMGHCQGRYCHYQSRFLLARERKLAPEILGGFTARFPARPTSIKDLLGTQSTDDLES
ncbi:NAD(P)/FAD-dependent oxidoreductase [Arenicella xantha]|uniref:Thioredoxin reductase n=1 Tax=Arenicella xantha TaxID=644221 RepID=A0A395JSY0_9GAMM|nr:NAD(P)/FAD-dependent oxidoreductase [Arenicella xantha]RBP53576.1 thioredoxin reductase [Arenicella xantha]